MENDQLKPYINASPRLPLIKGQQDWCWLSLNLRVIPTCERPGRHPAPRDS